MMVWCLNQTSSGPDKEGVVNKSHNDTQDHEAKTNPVHDKFLAGQLETFLPEKDHGFKITCSLDIERK